MPEEKIEEKPKNETFVLVEKAIETAQRIEAANKRTEELLQRQEELMARNILGGRSDAGTTIPEPKAETPQEFSKRFIKEGINPFKK